MAYINQTQDARRRATAIAGVVVVHATLALALLSLGVVVTDDYEAPFIGIHLRPEPKPTPNPPPPAKTPPPTQQDPHIFTPLPPTVLTPDPIEHPVSDGPIIDIWPEVDESPFVAPVPTPRPSPSFAPKGAIPANRPASWISTEDYPASPLRGLVEGVAGYRLVISSNGRVSNCQITRSSGNEDLDQASCRLISRRARFEPATDQSGASVIGTYTGSVRWEIPE